MHAASSVVLLLIASSLPIDSSAASDWPRFRGPDGAGISTDKVPPEKWSATENTKWKLKLPGPGSSSPIVVGERVIVTCWTGYATGSNDDDEKKLRRHLMSIDRSTGKVVWDRDVEPVLPEDPNDGMFTQHGYASHTPVSDAKHIYAFFGKTGLLAYDLDGNKLWQTSCGTGSGARGWGSASSPILYKNLVIVTAAAESESLVALDKETGKEVWRAHDKGFQYTWSTPLLVDCGHGRADLVINVPYKMWAFDPDTGKRRWRSFGLADASCASLIAHDNVIYGAETGPYGGGTIAVKGGGEGDVGKKNIIWQGKERSRVETPIYHNGRIYFVPNRTATCLDAATGKPVYQDKLSASPAQKAGGPAGGGITSQDYSSPVMVQGTIFYVGRNGQSFVFKAEPEFKLLATNRFPDEADFSASPAISDGALFVRSSKFLYCVARTTAN